MGGQRKGPNAETRTGRRDLSFTTFQIELDSTIAHEALEVLVFLRVHILRGLELFFGSLERFDDGLLIDLFQRDGVFGKNVDVIAFNLGESAADGEETDLAIFRHAEFTVLDLGKQRNVPGKNTDLTGRRWNDDGFDSVGIDPGLGRDDFERERHDGLFLGSGGDDFIDATLHVEITFGDVIELAIEDHLEAAHSLFNGNVFSGSAGEYLGNRERL